MEKLVCNAPWGKAKTSRFASVFALALAVAAGAMTAFGDGLPNGYTQVPFIKANGNCQVRTGLVPTSADKVEMTWRPMTVSSCRHMAGSVFRNEYPSCPCEKHTFIVSSSSSKSASVCAQ